MCVRFRCITDNDRFKFSSTANGVHLFWKTIKKRTKQHYFIVRDTILCIVYIIQYHAMHFNVFVLHVNSGKQYNCVSHTQIMTVKQILRVKTSCVDRP